MLGFLGLELNRGQLVYEVNFLAFGRALRKQVGGEIRRFLFLKFRQVLLGRRCWLALFANMKRHFFVLGPRSENVVVALLLL